MVFMYRVCHKSLDTFVNGCSSVISAPIDIKPIPLDFAGHTAYTSALKHYIQSKITSGNNFPSEASFFVKPITKLIKWSKCKFIGIQYISDQLQWSGNAFLYIGQCA